MVQNRARLFLMGLFRVYNFAAFFFSHMSRHFSSNHNLLLFLLIKKKFKLKTYIWKNDDPLLVVHVEDFFSDDTVDVS